MMFLLGTWIKELKTPYQGPKANAFCERFMGSLKQEYLDHILIFSQRQCRQILKEYVGYYNHARPHRGSTNVFQVEMSKIKS